MQWLARLSLLLLTILLLATTAAAETAVQAAGAPSRSPQPAGSIRIDPRLPVHPYLQYGAQVEPRRLTRVIVQKTGPAISSRAIAQAVGAPVLEEFAFIHSLVLTVPQAMVLRLAREPGVRYITYDAYVRKHAIDADDLVTTYPGAIDAPTVWNGPRPATGRGVTVAVLDTGVNGAHPDLRGQVTTVTVNRKHDDLGDGYGHGTHVAGIINGRDAAGRYLGVAPDAHVISVRIADRQGRSSEADLLRGLQWVADHRVSHDIRVVNLSLSVALPTSYGASPVAAAVEHLWRSGVVVVASAGNRGSAADAAWYPPGNDPFIISVGALDNQETVAPTDDRLADFSGRGLTQDGHRKPEIVAPGRRIVAPLAGPKAVLARELPDRITDERYLRLSGTSMSAPVVAGVVALLLERAPHLTPDQIKWLLMTTANRYPGQADAAGVVDPVEALQVAATGRLGAANAGLTPSRATRPTAGPTPPSGGASQWQQGYWDQGYWDQGYWDQGYWDQGYWDQGYWDQGYWD